MKRLFITAYLLLLAVSASIAQVQPSTDFKTAITRPANINAATEQADGKILLAGSIDQVDGITRSGIARLNPNGSLDPSFQVDFGDTIITAVEQQSDQKILAGGYYFREGEEIGILMRLMSDGSPDQSFQVDTFSSRVMAIEQLDNQRIVVGGLFRKYGPQTSPGLVMFESNGGLFRTFDYIVDDVILYGYDIIEAGDQFYVGGNIGSDAQLLRFSNTGQPDPGFSIDKSVGMKNFMTSIQHLDFLSNGNLAFTTYTWEFDPRLVVVTPQGTTVSSTSIANPLGLTVTGQDQILVSGEYEGRPDVYLVSNGTVTAFVPGTEADDQVYDLLTLSSGNILITGRFGSIKGQVREGVALATPARSLSTTFQPQIQRSGRLHQVLATPSGKVLVAGDFTQVNGTRIVNVARLNENGSLDATFQPTSVPSDKDVNAIASLANGKIMVGTSSSSLDPVAINPVFRLNSDGSMDNSFQIPDNLSILGNIGGFVELPDGRVIVYGAFSVLAGADFYQHILLFNADGSFDPSLSTAITGTRLKKVFLAGTDLIVAGNNIRVGGQGPYAMVSVSMLGTLNANFNTPLDTRSRVEQVVSLSDGGYLISGKLYDGLGYREILRLNSDGSRNTDFSWPIFSTTDSPDMPPRDALELGNGDIVLSNLSEEEEDQLVIISATGAVKETIRLHKKAFYTDFEQVNDSIAYLGGSFIYDQAQVSIQKIQFFGSNSDTTTVPVDTMGVDTMQQPMQGDPALFISSAEAEVGGTVCVSVSGQTLEGLLGMQLEINYDPSKLNFQNLDNLTGLPGLVNNDFGLPGSSNNPEGTIRLAWLDPDLSGYTVTDSMALFDICFTAVAASSGTDVEISFSELINSQDQLVQVSRLPGTVVITEDITPGGPDTVSVSIGSGIVKQGEVICLPVTVADFDDIMGLQFNVDYDSTKLQFQSLQNFNLPGLDLSTFGVPGTGANREGRIKLAWIDMEVNGVTVPDQTVIFEMCFVALEEAGTTDLTFSNIEITKEVGETVRFNGTEGQVAFQPGDSNAPDPTLVAIDDQSVRKGDLVCVPVMVEDFTDLIGMGFILNYDPTKLAFQSLGQYDLPNLSEDFFKLPGTGTMPLGQLEMTWFDFTEQGVTLADQTAIFEVCFQVLEEEGTTEISFSDIVIIGEDSNQRPFRSESGVLTLLPEDNQGGGEALTVSISSDSVEVDQAFCVQLTTENFTDIIGMQFTVSYDTSLIEYQSVGNFNLTGLSSSLGEPGQGNNPPGSLKVAWFDSSVEGVTLDDGTVLFEMCFIAKAEGATSLDFSGIEITGLVIDDVPFTGRPGAIVVGEEENNGGGTDFNNDNFTLVSADITTMVDESFCLPIRVKDFDGIKQLVFSYFYDPSLLSYSTIINTAFSGLAESIEIIDTGNDNLAGIRVNWVDPTGNGVSLDDEDVLMEICFDAIEVGVSNVVFDNATVVDANDEAVNFNSENAFVTVEPGSSGTNFFTFRVASDTVSMGESFCLDVSIENFTNVLGVKLNIDYDPELLIFEGVQNFNLAGLDNRSFDFPGDNNNPEGRVKLSWIDQNLQGVSLQDSTVIFQICFRAVKPNTVGTVSMSSPNILNINGNVLNFIGIGGVIMIEEEITTNTKTIQQARDRYLMYPVPTQYELNIEALQQSFDRTPFRLVDQRGAVVLTGELNDRKSIIQVNQLANGLYNLIIFEDSRYWSLPFIKL